MITSGRRSVKGRRRDVLEGITEPTDSSGLVAVIPDFAIVYGSNSTSARTYGEYQITVNSAEAMWFSGVFDSEYEYYLGIARYTVSAGSYLKMRLSENFSNGGYRTYRYQWLYGYGSTLAAADSNFLDSDMYSGYSDSSSRPSLSMYHIYSPYDSSTTTPVRATTSTSYNNSWNDTFIQADLTEDQNDGVYFTAGAGTFSGTFSWYAYRG